LPALAPARKERAITKSITLNDDDTAATAEWALTVRYPNPTSGGFMAFQKARVPGGSPDLRVKIDGEPLVDRPRGKTHHRHWFASARTKFRKPAVLTQ